MKLFLTIIIFTISLTNTFAQNVFQEKDYWLGKPNLEKVKQDFDKDQFTALNRYEFDAVSWAIIYDSDIEIIKYLIAETGIDINKRIHDKRTYIYWSVFSGNLEVFDFLMKKGAHLDVYDVHNYNLANYAASVGKIDTLLYEHLKQNGIDLNFKANEYGASTLLLLSPYLNNLDEAEYFIKQGMSLNDTDSLNRNIIYYASQTGNQKLIEELLANGITISTEREITNPIISAVKGTRKKQNTLEFYNFLIKNGANVNCVDSDGNSPLHQLIKKKFDRELFDLFLENGCDINAKNYANNTVLDLVISDTKSLELLKYLHKNGAQLSNGENLYDVALKNENFNKTELQFLKNN